VDVCGIAGDYCVLETIKGLNDIINPEHISVLMDLVASIDGGEKLTEFLNNNGINYFNIGNKE
jgi:nicotinamidase/pyrazinamidase